MSLQNDDLHWMAVGTLILLNLWLLAVRVVNALLTQLDQLKRLSNVLVVTTSNGRRTLATSPGSWIILDLFFVFSSPLDLFMYVWLTAAHANVVTGAIDTAFVDRADLKLYIGNPR